jgi:glutaredoxin
MIYVVVSDKCQFCDKQLDIMQRSFFDDEYKVVKVGSEEAKQLPSKPVISAVPFIVVADGIGGATYADAGVIDGTSLRKIDRRETGAFNLKKVREAQAVA